MMRLAALLLALAACDSTTATCRTWAAARCDREWACAPAETKANDGWRQAFGSEVAACAELQARSFCEEPERELCDGGAVDAERLDACADAIRAQACPEYLDRRRTPPACVARCE